MGAKTSKYKISQEVLICGICLNESRDQIITPCGHPFCYVCIDKWLDICKHKKIYNTKVTRSCPTCRYDFHNKRLIKKRNIFNGETTIYFR